MIKYTVGDATFPVGRGPKVIAHVCNDVGGWGRGFVVALSKRWKAAEAEYRKWARHSDDLPFELGKVQFVRVEPEIWVANMIGQHDIRPIGNVPPIRYEALEVALGKVGDFGLSQAASVHMPRIGCGLAGGTWEKIEPIIVRNVCQRGVDVTVYDLPVK